MRKLYPTLSSCQWPKAINDLFHEIYQIVKEQKSLRIGNYGEFYEGTQHSRTVKKDNLGQRGAVKTPVITRLSWRPFRYCKIDPKDRCETENSDRAANGSSAPGGGHV